MNIYFFGDTDQRAYTTSGAPLRHAYEYSGALQIFGHTELHRDTIYPTFKGFEVGGHDTRLNLRFYNALAYTENDIEITWERDSTKKHQVYRLNEKELLQLPKSQEFEMNYDINDDKKIVVVWTQKRDFAGLPEEADCYVWVVENELPNPDYFKSFNGKKVIVVKSDVLRNCGANISRSLSWEKTANETVWQCTQNKMLRDHLMYAQVVLIPFGLEGAVLIDNTKPRTEKWENTLWFCPSYMEGDMQTNHPGFVPEAYEALIYRLIHNIRFGLWNDIPLLESICRNFDAHLEVSIRVHICGYYFNPQCGLRLNYDYAVDSFHEKEHQPKIEKGFSFCSTNIPDHWRDWSIASESANQELNQSERTNILFSIVKKGPESAVKCPMLKIGNLVTIDRSEIESYSNIKNLLRDYIANKKSEKPLNLAVFGQPGSGKSFGVKEIAKNLLGDKATFLEYNLSQFSEANISALLTIFHDIQDQTLQGNIPFVFFDEFDSNELDWLKYFLMPMEDGCFIENGSRHPLGKCILIFAGGTNHSLEQLANKCVNSKKTENEQTEYQENRQDEAQEDKYAAKKLTDFLSRLRGYIDILGINNPEQSDQLNQNVLFRRAVILSNMIKQMKIDLSDDVIHALLFTREYKHGVRSMKAIIEMSRRSLNKQLELSDLPPDKQLELHVDSWNFKRRLADRILWEERHGRIARCLLWNDAQKYWDSCCSEEQNRYWKQAEKISEIIWEAFGLYIGLCGDTHLVPDIDKKVFIDTAIIDDNIISAYAEKLHKYLHKHKIKQIDEWHKCVDIEWDDLDEEAKEWLINTTRWAFTPFDRIEMDNTSYYLAGKLDDIMVEIK